jgi:hypothetical protein
MMRVRSAANSQRRFLSWMTRGHRTLVAVIFVALLSVLPETASAATCDGSTGTICCSTQYHLLLQNDSASQWNHGYSGPAFYARRLDGSGTITCEHYTTAGVWTFDNYVNALRETGIRRDGSSIGYVMAQYSATGSS